MKKLLLIAAILAIGTSAYAVSDGVSINFGDTVYAPGITANAGYELAVFPTDITTNDNAVHRAGAANIFRKKGRGWYDKTATHIILKLLKPIKIESEIDFLYTEAVEGDNVQIGDIGFTVTGQRPAIVNFEFKPMGIGKNLFAVGGKASLKLLGDGFIVRPLGQSMGGLIPLSYHNDTEKLEVDLYLNLANDKAGLYTGVIKASAMYF